MLRVLLKQTASLCSCPRQHAPRIEYQGLRIVGTAIQRNSLAVESDFYLAGISSVEDHFIVGANGLHIRRFNDAPHNEFAVAFDGNPGTVLGTDRDLKRW